MQNNITTVPSNGFQILITGISWNKHTTKALSAKAYISKDEELPEQFTLDVPENVLNQAKKVNNEFNDIIETFVYNFLTRKFGHEVQHCQIWLPLEEQVA